LPSGSTVSTTAFSFTVPGIASAGATTISVRDANNNSITAVSNTFTVAAGLIESMTIQTIGTQPIGLPFVVSGTISGVVAAPTLQYQDNAGGYRESSTKDAWSRIDAFLAGLLKK